VGAEFRGDTVFPDYSEWESTALFLGPVISYHQEKWWAALTIMPQIYGWNADESEDNQRHLDLAHNERLNIRLLIGINF
jgi:hypothetical protein